MKSQTIEEIEKSTADAVVQFVYDQIERKRRQASRQMLEFARVGAKDASQFRERLMLYLQVSEKFTKKLDQLVNDKKPLSWRELLATTDGGVDEVNNSVDEINELHGACQRMLESYPTHPSLLAISAATRLRPSKDDLERSKEELNAALGYISEIEGLNRAKELGNEVISYVSTVDQKLADNLHTVFGLWTLKNHKNKKDIVSFLVNENVRSVWKENILNGVLDSIPTIKEL